MKLTYVVFLVLLAAPAAAQVVYIDPDGNFAEPPPMTMRAAPRAVAPPVTIQEHADGSASADVSGLFIMLQEARIGPDGKVVLECYDSSLLP
jgi:hypothetical protein